MFGKVSVGIVASTRGLASGLSRASSQIRGFATGISRGIGSISIARALGITAAISALAKARAMASAYVRVASSVVEQQNRAKMVFGESAKAVLQFAQSAKTMGISERQALSAAGTFGTLFRNIGVTEKYTALFSTQLTTLAADMASFNEVTVDDSLRALRSALVGEVEPIRRLGIVLNDAALRQQAFAMGLVDTTRVVLTPQQKMLASYQAILKQATIQQGDFLRNSNTLANQQKKLTANLESLALTVGQRLIPVFLEWTTALNDVMPAIRALIVTIAQLASDTVKGMGAGASATEILATAIRYLGGHFVMLRGLASSIYAWFLKLVHLGSQFGEMLFGGIGAGVEFVESVIRHLIVGAMKPFTWAMTLIARGLKAIGSNAFADAIMRDVDAVNALANSSTGLGQAIEDSLKPTADQYRTNSKMIQGMFEEAANNARLDFEDPWARFDANLAVENMQDAAMQALGVIPAVGANFAGIIEKSGQEFAASVKELGAFVVGTSAGESFRNAILRGADPRISAQNDQRTADNTGRAADLLEDMPDQIGARLGAQFAVASVSV